MGGSGSDLEGGDQLLALISSHQDEILKSMSQVNVTLRWQAILNPQNNKLSFALDRSCLKIRNTKLDGPKH